MRRVMRFTSIIAMFLIIALVLIVFVMRAAYRPTAYDWLTWQTDPTCKLPCWRGITPGQTTFAGAETILQQWPDISLVMFFLPNGEEIWTGEFIMRTLSGAINGKVTPQSTIEIDTQAVDQLGFSGFESMSTDSFVADLGAPPLVFIPTIISDSTQAITLYWPQGARAIIFVNKRILNDLCDIGFNTMRATELTLYEPHTVDPFAVNWTGYAGLQDALCNSVHP